MSLRARVVVLIAAVLLVSMAAGALFAGFQARAELRAELVAALGGAGQTVASAFEDLPNSDHPARDLRQLIATFDGNRHVRAALEDRDGRTVRVSRSPPLGRPAPNWFVNLLGPSPRPATIPLPRSIKGFQAIRLVPTAELDASAAWRELEAVVGVLFAGAAIGLALVYFVIGAAFRPLKSLSLEFQRIGTGDYSGRVAERGPAELLTLQRGFNSMASELTATTARNRLLADQLLNIQEEERADIARDLHDDIGPHLFAVKMDAEMILKLSESGRHDAVRDQARSIQAAVGHMQRQVREVLGRLRPTRMTELGLNEAVFDLVRFWMDRRPDIDFRVSLLNDEAALPDQVKEIVFRMVQEATSNAVRHGQPKTVRIELVLDEGELCVSIVDDGAGDAAQADSGGLGLVGMRERVVSVGGSLAYGPTADGWTTQARLAVTSRALAPRSEARA
jgi:two-component system sensor histidine kinase UhpB